ncbi:MAG: putative ATP-grasp superfamily ATP-dependent carboligase [Mariniblastus sp.]
MRNIPKPLLILGASVRPWVVSSCLAGFTARGLDYFADWDGEQALLSFQQKADAPDSTTHELPGNRSEFIKLMASDLTSIKAGVEQIFNVDECAAILCGGFETRLDVSKFIAEKFELLGTAPKQLERLLDEVAVFEYLERNGHRVPRSVRHVETTADGIKWLRKQVGSSGGSGVRLAEPDDLAQSTRQEVEYHNCHNSTIESCRSPFYFQEFVTGRAVSCVFVSSPGLSGQRETVLLGQTELHVGDPKLGAAAFHYCGSAGPIACGKAQDDIQGLADSLAVEYEILGLWGIDFVVDPKGHYVPIDINPRLTASMELWEHVIRQSDAKFKSLIDMHVQACRTTHDGMARNSLRQASLAVVDTLRRRTDCEGKAVLFNDRETEIKITPAIFQALSQCWDPTFFRGNATGSSTADIPRLGESIPPGAPILTLRVRADLSTDVWQTLTDTAFELRNKIFHECSSSK